MIKLRVNGVTRQLDVEPEMPLLWALRDELHLTGTKYGCGIGVCGACMVHLDGDAVPSCAVTAGSAEGREITTIEGLSKGGKLHPVQQAWVAEDVPQCGYCQSGQIMAAVALLKRTPKPTDADIDAISNICRCGTYPRIRNAIHRVAGTKPKAT
jgi:aerobic-type carbon monoxide dehydrogenase small subunit (CoxS/CutS family)